ncbi:MAG TPA: diguanylate cyclase [Chloroflexia bacterium]|jgi:diguanylate cyclase (GGDEF)-like protein|nr:diguanylate cyclase [Chloroflexia bacterium]
MSRRAWAYIWGVLAAGTLLGSWLLPGLADEAAWPTCIALTLLATLALLFKTVFEIRHQTDGGSTAYSPVLVFFFAGVLLLPPAFLVPLVVIPHLIDWAKERWNKTGNLPAWYIQPFNIATYLIVGVFACALYRWLNIGPVTGLSPAPVLGVMGIIMAYVVLNSLFIGLALVLARGLSWQATGVLNPENLLPDFIMLSLGYAVALLWNLNPWLVLPVLSPLVLVSRALQVPQLKKEAQTDGKTGLANARHFGNLAKAELDRAARFNRPLALVMADLDLLRDVNNTYGHLAGDVVLTGIGQIIRETVREYDVAGRFGGEEFALVLPEAGPAEAQRLAERLRQAVEAASFKVTTSPTPIHVTMSLGVACFPTDGDTLTGLIHEADVAVYQAKLKGRNRVVCAVDVPHHIRLGDVTAGPAGEESARAYLAAHAPSLPAAPRPPAPPASVEAPAPAANAANAGAPAAAAGSPALGPAAGGPAESSEESHDAGGPSELLWMFVGGVTAIALAVTVLTGATGEPPHLVPLLLFALLAGLFEWLQINVYSDNTTSVSVAITFAAALVTGVPGVAVVSAVIALVHYLRRRPQPYKTAFNWATHLLAGAAVVLIMQSVPLPLQLENVLWLVVPTVLAALVQYAIESGLVAGAISLAGGLRFISTWRKQLQWLAAHYVVLGLMGLFLSTAYTSLGTLGVAVFTLPVLMMRYAQQQYVDRTKDSVQELTRMNGELARANREIVSASRSIQQLNDELFLTLSKILDVRDPYVGGHASQVSRYATAIAVELGLPRERVEQVRQAGFLHDIGKIAISEQILHKPSKLTAEEYEYVKGHAAIGAEFLATSQALRHLAPMVRGHHEHWDGAGYPDGLRGEEIPLEARILAVCDAVEAMASDRPYQPAKSLPEVIAEVRRCAGTHFDPAVVEVFIRVAQRDGATLVVNSAREVLRKQADSPDPFSLETQVFAPQPAPA